MNWDITIGYLRQGYGRLLQRVGRRLDRRQLVLRGEGFEYAARLQIRYGLLKHDAQWNTPTHRWPNEPAVVPVRVRTSQR